MPDADVLIVEGEETADAARVLLPQNVDLTWFGGSHAIDSADWTPLQCRSRIILWPDNDAQGKKAMQQVEAILMGLGVKACTVLVPSNFPHTWNLADPIPQGYDVLEIIKRTTA
jgi:putative DNA primase/helicase